MNDPYGLVASGLPPELAAQLQGLTRQQAIAQALLQQSMQAPEPGAVKGRFQGVVSPMEYIAKALQGVSARSDLSGADKGIGQLASQKQQMVADAMANYQKQKMGAPEVPYTDTLGGEAPQGPINPGVKANPEAAIAGGYTNPLIPRDFLNMENTTLARNQGREDQQAFLGEQAKQAQGERAARAEADRQARLQMHADSLAAAEQARKDRAAMLAAAQANKPEPAPAQGTILDPTDSSRMILINTREYKGGGVGSPGVIGVAGKEPTAAKQAEKVDSGRATVSDIASQLRGYYENLNKSDAITSTAKGPVGNVMAGLGNTDIGQGAARLIGTKAQSLRDSIAQQRPLLLQGIKEATGMTAKQMDSNAELKLYLSVATDPSKGYEANIRALDLIEKLYGKGGKGAAAVKPAGPGRVIDFNDLPK
jgi:hypothetical protein